MNKAQQKPNLLIKLDTNSKTITVDGNPNLKELFNGLKTLLPKDSPFGCWEEYKIECNNSTNWYPYYVYTNQNQWWNTPFTYTVDCNTTIGSSDNVTLTTTNSTDCDLTQNQGVYYISI